MPPLDGIWALRPDDRLYVKSDYIHCFDPFKIVRHAISDYPIAAF